MDLPSCPGMGGVLLDSNQRAGFVAGARPQHRGDDVDGGTARLLGCLLRPAPFFFLKPAFVLSWEHLVPALPRSSADIVLVGKLALDRAAAVGNKPCGGPMDHSGIRRHYFTRVRPSFPARRKTGGFVRTKSI